MRRSLRSLRSALTLPICTLLCATLTPLVAQPLAAQTDGSRGRKYKAPPETGHISVEVVRANNGKPIMNAAVVFHPVKDGKDEGNLEVKTDPDGKATIDVIPVGSAVVVQVIASGFATNAVDFTLTNEPKQLQMKMVRPRAQMSAYEDDAGQPAKLPPGVQEMKKHVQPATAAPTSAPATTSSPTPAANPNQ